MAVMDAEGDVAAAVRAIKQLSDTAAHQKGPKICIHTVKWPPQLLDTENMPMASVSMLHQCNRIFDKLLSLKEILNPSEEQQKCENFNSSELTDKAIASSVHQEMTVANRDMIDICRLRQ
ncbi:hypothetical protein BKA82DRAFT_29914 [Pisolithus tinctorius]|uniref:Uncharacterized protein n=1 Tax=Pisolithus tinctorius Marx 270 TaxID=870435 RepID=A0A0C3NY67_PISTI|nr:hypothetical protein BKA82DRAFT_29914 [Pisolithus tinctorius]KIO00094.1 hypothetical protein M404DRAFT_29914 [Pisolithus tinctorius Marx 270]